MIFNRLTLALPQYQQYALRFHDAKSCSKKLATLLTRIIISLLMITIINFSHFYSVFAETSLYLCEMSGKSTYQDLPCSDSSRMSVHQSRQKPNAVRESSLLIRTPDTGVTNGQGHSSKDTGKSRGKYYAQPQANTFQDAYVPELVNIEKQRRELQQINQQRRCEALRLELWRLDYGQKNLAGEKTVSANKKETEFVGEQPWLVRQRDFIQNRIQSQCKILSATE